MKSYTEAQFQKDIEAMERWEDEAIINCLLDIRQIKKTILMLTGNPSLTIDDFLELEGIKKRMEKMIEGELPMDKETVAKKEKFIEDLKLFNSNLEHKEKETRIKNLLAKNNYSKENISYINTNMPEWYNEFPDLCQKLLDKLNRSNKFTKQ